MSSSIVIFVGSQCSGQCSNQPGISCNVGRRLQIQSTKHQKQQTRMLFWFLYSFFPTITMIGDNSIAVDSNCRSAAMFRCSTASNLIIPTAPMTCQWCFVSVRRQGAKPDRERDALSCGLYQYKSSVNVLLRLLVPQGKAERQEGVGKRLEAQNSKTNRKSWCKKCGCRAVCRSIVCWNVLHLDVQQFPWLSASHQLNSCLLLEIGRYSNISNI